MKKHNDPKGGFWHRRIGIWEERYGSLDGLNVSIDGVEKISRVEKYVLLSRFSYNNKHLSLLNASYLLNAPAWTQKVKRRPGSVRVFIRSFTVNCIYSEYFMESAGVRYLRTSCWCIRNRTSERSQQVRFLIQKQSTLHVVLCLLYSYWDIHHFGGLFYFKSFKNAKICLYTLTAKWQRKRKVQKSDRINSDRQSG